ncbi:S8 family serine peptidase [Bifidobacterium bifidum]|uniref:S8 family serine peptidase n=1 Tax=Bifidobacterium bifidum TaxID=1681 RepID=UPI003D010655
MSDYMVSRWSRVKAGCAFALACVLPCAWTPGAFAADDGRWPVANDVVAAAWKQGIDGSGVKVAVLDSQAVEDYPALKHASITYKLGRFHNVDDKTVECKVGGKPLTATIKSGEGGYYSSHGTDMLAWIVGDGSNYTSKWPGIMGAAPKADVLHVTDGAVNAGPAVTPCDQKLAGDATSDSGADVKTAVDWDARILNRSQGGDLVSADYAGYVDALRHGVVMVGGRANDMNPGLDDLTGDPRSMETFPGVVMVNSVDESGNLASTSDVMDGNVAVLSYGMNVLDPVNPLSNVYNIAGNGGTSTAAAVLSSYLALAMQKWPDATGNQIIQSLIRNTKSGKGKPVIDPERKRGFGEVDLNALLTVDPTQYKDVNPILEYQMKAAAQYPDLKDWYTQDCKTNPDGVGTAADNVPCEAGLIGREYERQQAAWKKVEQCRSDGGSDCMQYSATNTADGETASTKTPGKSGSTQTREGASHASTWLPYVIAGGVAVLAAGVTIALIVAHRRRRARIRMRIPTYGTTYGSVRGYPVVPAPMPPAGQGAVRQQQPCRQGVPRPGVVPSKPYPASQAYPTPVPDGNGPETGSGSPGRHSR